MHFFLFLLQQHEVITMEEGDDIRGVLGNKCAGHHNLKTVQIRDIVWKQVI